MKIHAINEGVFIPHHHQLSILDKGKCQLVVLDCHFSQLYPLLEYTMTQSLLTKILNSPSTIETQIRPINKQQPHLCHSEGVAIFSSLLDQSDRMFFLPFNIATEDQTSSQIFEGRSFKKFVSGPLRNLILFFI